MLEEDTDLAMVEVKDKRKRSVIPSSSQGSPALPTVIASPPPKQDPKRLRVNQDSLGMKKGGVPGKPNDAKSATSREEDRRAQ